MRAPSVLPDEAKGRDAGVREDARDPLDLARDAKHESGRAAVRLRPDCRETLCWAYMRTINGDKQGCTSGL